METLQSLARDYGRVLIDTSSLFDYVELGRTRELISALESYDGLRIFITPEVLKELSSGPKQIRNVRLLESLEETSVDFSPLPIYQALRAWVLALEKRFKTKKQKSLSLGTILRTDEKLVAAALFLSAYGDKPTALIANDSDFKRLMEHCVFALESGQPPQHTLYPDLGDRVLNERVDFYWLSSSGKLSLYMSVEREDQVKIHIKNRRELFNLTAS